MIVKIDFFILIMYDFTAVRRKFSKIAIIN